jgi:predicted ABC-type transport system involved in lysophospholipase L1 biosynthesis ATPase subunit
MLRQRTLGFVFQAYNLFPFLTALENVLLPMQLAGRAQSRPFAIELLTQVGLAERIYHRSDELSGGEQQRVSIACALANRPALLLADEPTGELDSQTAQTIMELLTALNQQNGVAILMVTHDLSMAAYSHRLVQLRDGAIMPEGVAHA